MKATWCPVNVWYQITKSYIDITYKQIFRDDKELNNVLWTWTKFKDSIDAQKFSDRAHEATKLMMSLTPTEKSELVSDIKRYAREIMKDMEAGHWHTNRSIAKEMAGSTKWPKEILDNIMYLENLYKPTWLWYPWFFTNISSKTWLVDIYDNTNGSLKYAFLWHPQYKNALDESLMKKARELWMSEAAAKRFQEDMVWSPLMEKQWSKMIWGFKAMYTSLKASWLMSPLTWSMWLLNNVILWTVLYLSKRRGIEWILHSDAVNFLLTDWKFLASENRAFDTINLWYDQDWKNFFNAMTDKLFSFFPEGKANDMAKSVLIWWVHNIWDMSIESTIKRLAVWEALSKHWITTSNMDIFMKNLQEWKISEEFLTKLRADSHLAYMTYFTSWAISSLNRNRFSRMWYINTLQNYVTSRSDDVWSSVVKFTRDYRSWKFKTWEDFTEYLARDNTELKSVINNILLTAKAGIYINAITGDKEDNGEISPYRYVNNMSDYLSSLTSSWFYRLLTAPVRWLDNYYDYTSATGQPESFIEWASVAWLQTLSDTLAMLFKEWKILNALTDTAIAFAKTWDIDFAKDVAAIDIDKISNGMGRFTLLPWVDSYWQTWIPGKEDTISRFLFAYPEFNEAAKANQRIRDISTIENMINDTGRSFLNMFTVLPIINSAAKLKESNVSSNFTEASWKVLQNEIDTNPVMQKIWNGEFPTEILDNPDIVDNLYSELTAHSYYGKKILWGWTMKVSEYWLTKQEESVFTQNILEKSWLKWEELEAILRSKPKKAYLIKAIAAAEAEIAGSSKLVLGYLANDALYKMKKWASNAEIPEEVEQIYKKNIVEQLYPYTYFADKTSWYKLAREYMSAEKPDILWALKSNSDLTSFVNTLWFTDMIYWNEAKQWDVDAKYIKNIFNVTTKYVKDDVLRTKIVNNALDTISSLDATQSQKGLMRIWTLAANIDHYNQIKADPVSSIMLADDIKRFEKTMWGTIDWLNNVGITWMEHDMNDTSRSQYYWSKGKLWKQNSNYDSNRQVADQLDKKINNIYKPAQYGNDTSYVSKPWDQSPISNHPREYSLYLKLYNESYNAASHALTKQWGWDKQWTTAWYKYSSKWYNKLIRYWRWSTVPKLKSKQKHISTTVRRDLPWG